MPATGIWPIHYRRKPNYRLPRASPGTSVFSITWHEIKGPTGSRVSCRPPRKKRNQILLKKKKALDHRVTCWSVTIQRNPADRRPPEAMASNNTPLACETVAQRWGGKQLSTGNNGVGREQLRAYRTSKPVSAIATFSRKQTGLTGALKRPILSINVRKY